MAEKPEDFNMPAATVANIIKQALPEGVTVSADVRSACSRCASIFILYVTTCANNIAAGHKRKTLTAQDVIDAIAEIGFNEFVPELTRFHNQLKEDKERKQRAKLALQKGSNPGDTSKREEQMEDEEEDEGEEDQ